MKITQTDNGPLTIVLEDNLEYLACYFGIANFSDSITRIDSTFLKKLKTVAGEMTKKIDEETMQIEKVEK